ncbi:ketoacyl-synt-domain-containing protein [Pseudovirgaria hyperparasitica]|uniref:Ketoacyl-synt-domain-containing protein n=1 Tax=Pseudovirgaria hyperparasitica TaxID=470096 RepID=A0A6A6VWE4_9PEZI|nr:ketoacyl-synt-domain-containing protein [Pseudovirgaria hyperparasitica]KAF2755008.1 ketoacyl-synt-domain-containing protein [Pseudovirgaria hyperparasitica]
MASQHNLHSPSAKSAPQYDPAMPIAVVGLSCRFPDTATSPQKFWDFLVNARCALKDIPKDRFNIDAFWHPDSKRHGSINVRGGYFLEQNIAAFDAPFFSLTAAEAVSTDPQQRLLLETAYEAIENAGICMSQLAGSQASCYVGSFMKDYQPLAAIDAENLPVYGSTGHSTAFLSNRISHFFDLRGPSMTLDTGCSGSSVAFHLACESIRTGEATVALAGGVGAILAPDPIMSMGQLNFLSPDSKCYSFDHRANGYARGEGFSILVLKSLDDAIRDNDTIRAVVRASSVCQDGKTPGITLPSSDAQADLIASTYRKARLSMLDTQYFEAHGTGTTAGDAAELRAIGRTIGANRRPGETILCGSVKPNIGHLEGCAGLAGILKAIMAVEQGLIPQNLWFEKPSPENDLDAYRVTIPTELTTWPTHGIRRASINCFGFGGTLAHVIIDDAASYLRNHGLVGNHNVLSIDSISPSEASSDMSFEIIHGIAEPESTTSPKLYVWSSPEQSGVTRLMNTTHSYLDGFHRPDLVDEELASNLSYTLCSRRSTFAWRSFSVATSTTDLHTALGSSLTAPTVQRSTDNPKIAFVFNGQGGHWGRMGHELLVYDTYRQSIAAADRYMQSLGAPWSALTELSRNQYDSKLDQAEYSQPLCTVLQVAIVDLLCSWDVKPVSVIGHSSGEIAAAYASHRISREDAWCLAYHRGRGSAALARDPDVQGSMMAVGLSRHEAEQAIKDSGVSDVVVACINSPKNVTLSGNAAGIEKLRAQLDADGVFARLLKVECPYHSPYMRKVVDKYTDAIKHIRPTAKPENGAPRMFSTVYPNERQLDLGPSYWISNLISPVEFTAALEKLMAYNLDTKRYHEASHRADIIVEIGPHATLQSSIRQIFEGMGQPQPIYASTLIRNKHSAQSLLSAMGTIWAHGYPVSLSSLCRNGSTDSKLITDLPPYPWNHSKLYWHEARASAAYRFRKLPRLDLVGALTPDSNNIDMKWRNTIRVKEMPWVLDHQVQGTVLYPAAGMLCMVLEAARQILDTEQVVQGFELQNVKIGKAMIIPTTPQGLETSLTIRPKDTASPASLPQSTLIHAFHITARLGEQPWQEHCSGEFRVLYKDTKLTQLHWTKRQEIYKQSCVDATPVAPADVYAKFEATGLKYGPMFQTVHQLKLSPSGVVTATIRIPDTKSSLPENFEQPHLLHPTTLDGLFQTVVLTASDSMVPTSIERIYVSADLPQNTGGTFRGYATSSQHGLRGVKGNMIFGNEDFSAPKVILEGVGYTRFDAPTEASNASTFIDPKAKLCSAFVWNEDVNLGTKSISTSLSHDTSIDDFLLHYCSILAHKTPKGSVLEVGQRSMPFVESMLLHSLHSAETAPPFFQYNVTNTNDNGKRICEKLENWAGHLEFRPLQIHKDPQEQGYVANTYHLLIFNVDSVQLEDAGVVLDNLRLLLNMDAKIILLQQNTTGARSDWNPTITNELLAARGFNSIHQRFQRDGFAVICGLVRPQSSPSLQVADAVDEIILVQPTEVSQAINALTDAVKAELLSQGHSAVVMDVETATTACKDRKCISLLELERPFISGMSEHDFQAFRQLTMHSSGTLWLTRGAQIECSRPDLAPVHGIFRSMRNEDSGLALYTLDLDCEDESRSAAKNVVAVFRSVFVEEYDREEYEYAVRDGKVMIPRVKEMNNMNELLQVECGREAKLVQTSFEQEPGPLSLDIGAAGQYDSLRFVVDEQMMTTELADDEVEVSIKAVHLRSVDYHTFSGQTTNTVLGQFAAGFISRLPPTKQGSRATFSDLLLGDRVVIFEPSGGLVRNRVRVPRSSVKLLPQGVQYEEACALSHDAVVSHKVLGPHAHATSILLLCTTNETALSLIRYISMSHQHESTRVWIVVKSQAQKADLIRRWRKLFAMHDSIFFNQTTILIEDEQDCAEVILEATGQEGVELVVLGQDEEITDAVCDCLSQDEGSRIVHVIDIPWLQKQKPLVLPDTTMPFTYTRVDLNASMSRRARKGNHQFHDAMTKAFSMPRVMRNLEGTRIYDMSQISSALNDLSQSSDPVVVTSNASTTVAVVPRPSSLALRQDATYMIVGGFGGVGHSLAQYLVRHGAKYLAIISRSGANSPDAYKKMVELEQMGASDVKGYACDVCNFGELKDTITRIECELPPLAGLIHSAMSLSDTLFEKMSYDTYCTAARPKIEGSYNLHTLLPNNLDFFILMSSVAGVVGTRGQANYNAGNAYQNALATYRQTQGLRGSAIALTVTTGVGWLAGSEKSGIVEGLKSDGVGTITMEEVQALLTPHFSTRPDTPDADLPPAETILGISSGGLLAQSSIFNPLWAHDNRFSWYRRLDLIPEPTNSTSTPTMTATKSASLNMLLPGAASLQAATTFVLDALVAKLASSLLMPETDIDTSKPISSYGVDSLVAVEVRNWIFREARAQVSVFELLAGGPIKGMAEKIARKSALVGRGVLDVPSSPA